jgi:hypothetical protein
MEKNLLVGLAGGLVYIVCEFKPPTVRASGFANLCNFNNYTVQVKFML